MNMSPYVIPAEDFNKMIAESSCDRGKISDGYHTFEELYEHRSMLYLALCSLLTLHSEWYVWKSLKHSDGTSFPGWFVMGISKIPGQQITYHLPISYWQQTEFAHTLEKAPEFDGHTSKDVLKRLRNL